jgi:hypothetical protein
MNLKGSLLLLLVGAAMVITLGGCSRKTPVLTVIFEGYWDSGEIKNCQQIERNTKLHMHELVLLCGHIGGDTLFAMKGHTAEYEEYLKNGPSPDRERWKEIRDKGQDDFFYKHGHEYTVRFAGKARPVPMGDGESLIYWSCSKDERGLSCVS